MTDALEVSDVSDLKVGFAKGDRVVRRDKPLLPPLIVDHVRTWFCGEPEPNGPVFCFDEDARPGVLPRAFDQCRLVPCPADYEPPPSPEEPWRAVLWLRRNWALLVSMHGPETAAATSRHVYERMRQRQQMDAATAAEPGANAMRRAEIALAQAGR